MIDLHSHSTCSDGSETPTRVIELAAEAGCHAIALTDHDGLGGIEEARAAAAQHAIRFVPGCEVSCKFNPGTMHVLCYFVEPGDGPLQDQLERLRNDRVTRNDRLIARLNELDIPITLEQVAEEAGGSTLGRPHFAEALVKLGAVKTYQDAFDKLLAKGGPAYIPKAFIDAPTTIDAATGSGALAVLAHPLSLKLEPAPLEQLVGELAEAGLTGMECYYGRYSPEEREGLAAIAARHGLVATGGSDYHGTHKPDLAVGTGTGDLDVPDSALSALEERRVG
jgi:predicted metal-dependent phosphoesterase TrpH